VKVTERLDPENVYRAWFELHGCRAALVRPDFYVFGTAVTAEQTCKLARHLEAALSSDQNDRGENQ
jgi:3-(3-hydroxy-phenyl)propionate hydroxylase